MTDAIPSAQMAAISPTRVGKYVYTLDPSHTVASTDVSVKPYALPQYAALVITNSWCLTFMKVDTNIWMECV